MPRSTVAGQPTITPAVASDPEPGADSAVTITPPEPDPEPEPGADTPIIITRLEHEAGVEVVVGGTP